MDITGLTYIDNFITESEESELINNIEKGPWNEALSRRTQHYGYKYSYKSKKIDLESVEPIPVYTTCLVNKLKNIGLPDFDQLIINEYKPGQGIANHIDNVKEFGPKIVSVSLGSDIVMNFLGPNGEKKDVFLKRRSVVILELDARYTYKHGIAARKSDVYNNIKYIRGTRLSLTFRTMNNC